MTGGSTVYVIASLEVGGAQTGLLRLVDLGFVEPRTTHLVSFAAADKSIREGIDLRGPWAGLTIVERGPALVRWAIGATLLAQLLMSRRPDLVVLSLEPANLVGRFLRFLSPQTRFCSFEHSSRYRRRLYRCLLPFLARSIDVVLYDSLATRQGIAPYYRAASARWIHAPLFVADPEKPRKANWEIGGGLRILSVGRLVPAKNHFLLVETVAELKRRGFDVNCEIVGEGPLRSAIEHRCAALGLGSSVRLIGQDTAWQGRAPTFDVYVQTSEHEGACLTVLEAMQAGLPVVATPAGEIPLHLADGAGIVVEPPTASGLADAIEGLARDPDRRAALGRTASTRVATLYDRQVLVRRLSTIRASLGLSRFTLSG
ncbi:MAG: glycosyltransferase [Geminicoccaceae bacterium]|nr:glycosyltransferase [Geminicoccaceae bacterium]